MESLGCLIPIKKDYVQGMSNPKKKNYSLLLLAYVAWVIFFASIIHVGIIFSLLLAIPTAMFMILFAPIITGTISGIIKGVRNEIRK